MRSDRHDFDNVLELRAPRAAPIGDMRFRALLGAKAWAELPAAVQARFSKRLSGTASAVYTGEVIECSMSRAGWWLAQALRIIGAPLPLTCDTFVPAVVSVTEDEAGGGQFWLRQYGRHTGFPQVIHSSKRFAGTTGLEEYIGGGVGVALTIAVKDATLMFVSDHYFAALGKWRMRLPRWMTPGRLTVGHVDCGDGWFAFTLLLEHKMLGTLVNQTALFCDSATPKG